MTSFIKTIINRLWGNAAMAEKINYLIFGVLTTAVNFAVFFITNTALAIDYRLSTMLAWAVAVAFAFVVNKRFVFKSKTDSWQALGREVFLFLSARVASLLFDMGWMILAVEALAMNELLAKILSNVVVVVINYIFSKAFIFKKKTGEATATPAAEQQRRERILLGAAFLLPVFLLLCIFIGKGIYPAGNNTMLIVDNYHQYTPFMMEFGDILRQGGSLFYNWNAGLGSNFFGRYAYYLSSPLNFLSVFIKRPATVEFVTILVLLRTGLAGWSFAYYLREKYKAIHIHSLIIPVLYALGAFFLAYYWNIMWFDGVALFPLVVLGLERLVNGQKGTLYGWALGLTIITNFFIAILVCIASVLYFLVYAIGKQPEDDLIRSNWWTWFVATGIRFALYSLLAGGLSAIVSLPTYFNLLLSSSANASMPQSLDTFSSMMAIFANHLLLTKPTVMTGTPNVYCGVIVFLLVPLYFLNRNIPLREKILNGTLVAFLLASFNLNVLNFLWHGGHYPNSLPHRFSFLYVFVVLGLAYRALNELEGVEIKHIGGALGGAALLLLTWENGSLANPPGWKSIYATIGFLAVYSACLGLLRWSKKSKGALVSLLLVGIIGVEVVVNGINGFAEAGLFTHDNYVTRIDTVLPAVEALKDREQGFERMEFVAHDTYNTPVVYDYKGISHYSSTSMIKVNDLFGRLGLVYSTAWYVYESSTPLFNSLFSLKYLLSKDSVFDNSLYPFVEQVGNVRIYENPWVLPLGFMVQDTIDQWDTYGGGDPFMAQQNFIQAATGLTDVTVFRPLSLNESDHRGISLSARSGGGYDLDDGGDGYARFYTHTSSDGPTYWFVDSARADKVQISNASGTQSHPTRYPYIIDAGVNAAGDLTSVDVTITKGGAGKLGVYAYGWNQEAFEQVYNALNDEVLLVTDYTDTQVTGTIFVREKGTLFTSIPYEEGWRVTVDGRPVPTRAIADGALLALSLEPGTHEIVFRYHMKGFWPGLIVTLLSLAIFLLLQRPSKEQWLQASSPAERQREEAMADDDDFEEDFLPEDFEEAYEEVFERGTLIEEVFESDFEVKWPEPDSAEKASNSNAETE